MSLLQAKLASASEQQLAAEQAEERRNLVGLVIGPIVFEPIITHRGASLTID